MKRKLCDQLVVLQSEGALLGKNAASSLSSIRTEIEQIEKNFTVY
jgi:hypothetical protein